MKILLKDIDQSDFYPLCLTRPISGLRLGILTIAEKWEIISSREVGSICRSPLNLKFPALKGNDFLIINARLIPTEELWSEISTLSPGEEIRNGSDWIAGRYNTANIGNSTVGSSLKNIQSPIRLLKNIHELFLLCGDEIKADFQRLTKGKNSGQLHESNTLIGPSAGLFIEEGAKIHASILNTNEGPIYIGKDAEVMEGSMLRGPFALGEGATVKMGAKIYGPTSIGLHSKVGGELSNVVIQGYSNKGHDGFLGNSILGEWCNLGADTNTSNLKNNYSEVRTWNYSVKDYVPSGLTFCGLIMGDHSKCSINTMFNTGTVVGVNANIFGHGFPPKLVPSFSWGGSDGFSDFDLEKAFKIAEAVYARRGVIFTDADRQILTNIRDEKPENK